MSARECKRFIDVFATLVLLFVVTVQTYTLFDKVVDHPRRQRADLRSAPADLAVLPVAWLGDVSAVLLIAIRTYRLIFQPEEFGSRIPDQAGRVIAVSGDADRRPRLRRAVRADAAARAGRHGDGARRRQRLCLLVGGAPALKMVGQTSMRTVTDYTFGVIPMFLLMGAFVSNSGMSRELFRAANTFVGHLRGGLGIATIAACAGFAAICGSSVATAATFATVAYPEMRRLRLSAVVRDRRDRRRRNARRHVAAFDRARRLRHHHRAGHRQAVHRRNHSRPAGGHRWTC